MFCEGEQAQRLFLTLAAAASHGAEVSSDRPCIIYVRDGLWRLARGECQESGIRNQEAGEFVHGGARSLTGGGNEFPLIRDCPGCTAGHHTYSEGQCIPQWPFANRPYGIQTTEIGTLASNPDNVDAGKGRC